MREGSYRSWPPRTRFRAFFGFSAGIVLAGVLLADARGAGSQTESALQGTPAFTAGTAQENPNRPPWAQKGKDASAAKPTAASAEDSDDSGPQRGRIKVNVNLVNVLASVLDEHNRPATDLPRESFHLYEEGVEQKIQVFEPETQLPLDLALMVDASLSAHKEINFEEEAAARFIRQVLRTGDRLAVYAIGEDVTEVAGFSDNVATLQSAVHHIPAGGGTSIYDAIQLASRSLAHRGEDRRRVIILVSDAGETTSITDFDSARREAVRSGSLLYTIVVRPVKNESGRNTAGEHALETITDTMGGAMFFPDQIQELDGIFEKINRELRTQYRLGYYPNPRGPANTYRSIEVKVTGDAHYQVRHRKSYLTGPQ
jgi:Ca-activated chloride channel homolog